MNESRILTHFCSCNDWWEYALCFISRSGTYGVLTTAGNTCSLLDAKPCPHCRMVPWVWVNIASPSEIAQIMQHRKELDCASLFTSIDLDEKFMLIHGEKYPILST